jgi:hypothetical protein
VFAHEVGNLYHGKNHGSTRNCRFRAAEATYRAWAASAWGEYYDLNLAIGIVPNTYFNQVEFTEFDVL